LKDSARGSIENDSVDESTAVDSGLNSLVTIAALHGIAADRTQLQHEFGQGTAFTVDQIHLAARGLGLSTRTLRQPIDRIDRVPLPAIAQTKEGDFFIVAKFDRGSAAPVGSEVKKAHADKKNSSAIHPTSTTALLGRLLIQFANEPAQTMSVIDFSAKCTGAFILFTSKASFAGEIAKFDFTWFIPAVVKYRRLLLEVLLISLVLQLIGLATPLFFQVIMDKVLVNHAMKTLDVIAIGLIFAIVFEVVLTGIRTYVFSHTSSKIDVELGARLFKHVLNLPVSYFQSRRIGDSVARIRELENIRSFLTGNAITLLLDLMFSFVFIGIMLWYSPWLTLIAVFSIPGYFAMSLIFTPILRTRLNEKFNRSAENQSFLVETIGGMETIKALAIEPRWQSKWEKQLAGYVAAGLSTTSISTIANGGVTLISKLTTAAIMWVGANLALEGKITIGELVAFNMLAGQVSSPILRLAQLWNDFQQVGISMSRLGDILNTRTEVAGQKSRIPRLAGAIEFDNVFFRYKPDAPDVLRALSLNVSPGEVVGVVGRSGSGKSTLTKLIQRLYVPDRGRVLVDGHDLSIIDTVSLRRQIGVVLQENTLFARSIRDNIAVGNPAYSIEAIIGAAKLSGAHDFICELPEGYDTPVGEHGAGLSGGQRQRIAIARALIGNPRILIFDEATSALDYESEKVIQDNMRRICEGRTVLIIAHRLSTVRGAHRIVVIEHGEIAEVGSHEQLLQEPNGIYAHLHRLQAGTQEYSSAGHKPHAGAA
jgi:subfamily B ATP-binding cassette protein HlyB/CyaB